MHAWSKENFARLLVSKDRWDIDAIFIPEQSMDLDAEVERLKKVMDEKDGVNIFLSEGAGSGCNCKRDGSRWSGGST